MKGFCVELTQFPIIPILSWLDEKQNLTAESCCLTCFSTSAAYKFYTRRSFELIQILELLIKPLCFHYFYPILCPIPPLITLPPSTTIMLSLSLPHHNHLPNYITTLYSISISPLLISALPYSIPYQFCTPSPPIAIPTPPSNMANLFNEEKYNETRNMKHQVSLHNDKVP